MGNTMHEVVGWIILAGLAVSAVFLAGGLLLGEAWINHAVAIILLTVLALGLPEPKRQPPQMATRTLTRSY